MSTTSKQALATSRRVMLVLMSLSTLYDYLYIMMVSNVYGLLPVYGGTLFMTCRVASIYAQTFLGENRKYLMRLVRVVGTVLLGVMLLCSLLLTAIYPVLLTSHAVWALFALALALTLRSTFGRRLSGYVMRGRLGKPAFGWMYAALQLVPAGVMAWLLFGSLPTASAWQALGGFGLSILLQTYTFWRERELISLEYAPDDTDPATILRMGAELRTVHAYSAYQRMHTLILVALQVTLVMAYTFIGVTSDAFLTCLAVSAGCMLLMRELTDQLLSRLKHRKPAVQMLLFGLFLWLYGLVLIYRQMGGVPNLLLSYAALGLCSSGLTISISCLAQLEREMVDVAEYKLQEHMQGYDRMRAVNTELAIALGQLLALVLLTLLCIPAGLHDLDLNRLVASFRPMLIVPSLLLVAGALLCLLRFPMNNRTFDKLKRFLTLQDEDNPALKKQLDEVVIKKHKARFGVKIIITLLRPLYYHRVLGRENVAGYEEGTMILVCNHGELYGPVVTNLYVPISFRPWCISSMMDESAIVDYIYRNTSVRQKWCPDRLKLPLTKLLCPVFLWVFRSIDAIPVYRSNPRELVKTFRLTVEAMQAGDNILVFPETGAAAKPGEKGYVSEGVGNLYTGFAMIAPAYYARTKKRAVFVPLYASKHTRTITIGPGVHYHPEAPANEEKLRIVHELQTRMQSMYEQELAALKAANDTTDAPSE